MKSFSPKVFSFKKALLTSSIALFVLSNTALTIAKAQLDDIIVTARKREESLQDVPIGVTVVTGETIEQYGFDNIRAMARRVPGLKIYSGGSGQGGAVYYRGIGAQLSATSFDSSIAFSIDSAILNTPRLIQNSFFDIQTFEFLRGPQPFYFGKSATAGVVLLHTNNPTDEFGSSFGLSYDTELYATIVEGIVNVPLLDTLKARLALRDKTTDRQYQNIAPDVANPWRGEESTDIRLTLDWAATDSLNINFKHTGSSYKNDGQLQFFRLKQIGSTVETDGRTAVATKAGQTHNPDPSFFAGTFSNYYRDGIPYTQNDTSFTRLEAKHDVSDNTQLIAIIAHTAIESESMDNFTFTTAATGLNASLDKIDSTSVEIRLEVELNEATRYTIGTFVEGHTQLFDSEQYIGLGRNFVTLGSTNGTAGYESAIYDTRKIHETDSETNSHFLTAEYDMSDRLTASIGVRHTNIRREGTIEVPYVHDGLINIVAATAGTPIAIYGTLFSGACDTTVAACKTPVLTFDDEDTNVEAMLDYALTRNANVYIAYKEAFKPGGIDTGVTAWNGTIPNLTQENAESLLFFGSETVAGFEAGYKSQIMDNQLRLNALYYNYEYRDFQTQTFQSAIFQFGTTNAGQVSSEGYELDVYYAPASVDGLNLFASLAYDVSEFDVYTSLEGNDLASRRLGQSPEISGTAGINYDFEISASLMANLGYVVRYSDEYFTENQRIAGEEGVQAAYNIHDLSISLRPENATWTFSIAASNIFDKIYSVYTTDGLSQGSTANAERDKASRDSDGRSVIIGIKFNF